MKKGLLLFFAFLFFGVFNLNSQRTVGLLSYKPWLSYDGYNMIYPHNQPTVYLLNNCGQIVHRWDDNTDFRPGNTAYLLEDGRLIKTKRPASVAGNPIWAGGGGGTVEIRDWENNLEWSFTMNDSLQRLHHDIAPMPNGNILMIAWEKKNETEALQAGRDPALLPQAELWPEKIIEVDPSTSEIVWEWYVWDHLVQEFDPTKDNYGVVADHPELIHVNYETSDGHPDWLHANAIDYDPINDQIAISIPTFDEIWIIDHSTTTQQAAGHIGGLGGKGGDLLYRWGNPIAYQAGTADDQKLFYQHDIQWVDDFLDPGHPYYRKMAVFNNRVGADFSTANVFSPNFDMYEWEYPLENGVWPPAEFDLVIQHPEPTELYSTGLSSIQFLPNGNALICSGRYGYSFEITPDNEIVWEYKTPLLGGQPVAQGAVLEVNNNLTFRMKRIPADYPAFDGKDLSSQGYMELDPEVDYCDQVLPTSDLERDYQLELFPNPASQWVTVEWKGGVYSEIACYDLMGRMMNHQVVTGGRKYLDVSGWEAGVYFVRVDGAAIQKLVIQR